MQVRPEELVWTDAYKLLIGSVVPRPIAFVSTMSRDGTLNLAPFSFFNGVCPKPFIISFAPMFRPSDMTQKDTLANIRDTEEFVVHIVSEGIVEAMNRTAADYPCDVNEFEVAGLTPVESVAVKPPRVKESLIQMECKLEQILTFGDEPGAGSLVLGRVVVIHVADEIYRDGRIDIDGLQPVSRLAGNWYGRTTDRFELARPSYPPKHN